MYHLLSKDLVTEDSLPSPYQSYLRQKQYALLTSETWWVGLLIASNIEYLVQNLLDLSEGVEKLSTNKAEQQEYPQPITKIIERINEENGKLDEFRECWQKAFFVDFDLHETGLGEPAIVEKTLVKERINRVKQRIKIGQPFLSLSLTDAIRRIANQLVMEAFQRILPLRSKISQLTFPLMHSDEVDDSLKQLKKGELEDAPPRKHC